jgi:hypothetical protein
MLMPGQYQQHYHIQVNGTALLPQFAEKAQNGQNKPPGLILLFLCPVKGPFIITTPREKTRKNDEIHPPRTKKNVRGHHGDITPVSESGFSHSAGRPKARITSLINYYKTVMRRN